MQCGRKANMLKRGGLAALLGFSLFQANAQVTLPPGVVLETYASDVANARQMAQGDKGTVFVGSRGEGKVYAVYDHNQDYRADKVQVLASGLTMPSGIAYHKGDLYVAEVDKIWRYPQIEASLPKVPKPELVFDQLPDKTHHGWKNIAFGPDGRLYIPVGAPCNICDPAAPFSTIFALDVNTGKTQTIANGVRNSVGFDWHPQSGELWFSDNGRDWMGDDMPPDEINRVTKAGQHFGYPYFHGGKYPDPEFGKGKAEKDYVKPALNLGAHVAPLGIHFYRGTLFPERYRNQLFVAEHGSWNRSTKVGYKIGLATLNAKGEVTGYEDFATGWVNVKQDTVSGRPVAFLAMKDGSLLVSDDFAGAIYRIRYDKREQNKTKSTKEL